MGRRNMKTEKILETLDVEIKTIDENDKKNPPIIGYFPSGFDPLKNSNVSDAEGESGPSIKVYKNLNSRNQKNPRMQLVVGASGSAVSFVGTNYSGEATTPQLCKYALGVLDKETGVLKMVSIAANRIFRLDPKVEEPENELPNAFKKDDTAQEKNISKRDILGKYSTKGNERRDEKIEALRKTGDAEMQEDLAHKLKGVIVKTEALEAIASAANALNIPPYDLEATASEMAYPLDKIILKGEWDYLLDIFELTNGGKKVPSDVYPSFVCNRLHKLETIKDETKKKRIAGVLSYITHLIKFKDKHSMNGVSSAKHHKLPSILQQKFSSMFGTTKEKRVPDENQKLLISYVLVLSLFVDDFRSDPSDIAKDLRMNVPMLRDHYLYLGCKFVGDNKAYVATLPVPLDLQTVKRKRKRKRS